MPPEHPLRKLTCLIIDDEPLARAMLADYCAQVPFLELVGAFSSALAALAFLQTTPVDLLLLDIHMPRLNGLQFLQTLPAPAPAVIFTTAHERYAVRSYEFDVADYLLKPIAFNRFLQATTRVYRAHAAAAPALAETAAPAASIEALFVKHDQRLQRVAFKEILYVEGCKEYLLIYTATDKIITLQSFRGLAALLPPADFVRVHKSFLVALRHIDYIERNRVQVAGRPIPIGETYRETFTDGLRAHGVF
jgi:two-component system LytT family response regulator